LRNYHQEALRVAGEVAVSCRAVLFDDPALGFGPEDFPAPGVFAPRPPGLSESLLPTVPVLLFEPERALEVRDGAGRVLELQTEMIVAAGLPRVRTLGLFVEPTGWQVAETGAGVELRAGDGGLWARGRPRLSEAWRAAVADNAGAVLVFYGLRLGVRVPPGVDEAGYGAAARAGEFRAARAAGLVAGGMATWAGS
jgi:hypothetical protein